jgi:hypothetical protein
MQSIEKVKEEKSWQHAEPKEYYTQLTDILRTYIQGRFGINAMEMTSSEIINALMENVQKSKEDLNELIELFRTADLVKFAKHNPMINENDANLLNAIDFINETKPTDEESMKPQPTEITIVEKRPLRTKILLAVGIVAFTGGMIAIIIYAVKQLSAAF